MTWLTRIACTAAISAALLASSGARAQDRESPIAQRNDAEATLIWNSARYSGSSIGLVPALHYEILPQVFLDAFLPLTLNIGGVDLTTERGSAAHAAVGNPTLGLHYASTRGRLTWFAGGRISLPLAAFHSQGYQYADLLALDASAAYDSFLWAPEYFPLSGTAGMEFRASRPLYLRASIDPMLFIATSSRGYVLGGSHASILSVQARLEAEGRSRRGLGGGLALLGVFQLTSSTGDTSILNRNQAEITVNPFVSFDNGAFFGRLGMLLALNQPLGFGFEHSRVFVPTTAALVLQIGKYLQ